MPGLTRMTEPSRSKNSWPIRWTIGRETGFSGALFMPHCQILLSDAGVSNPVCAGYGGCAAFLTPRIPPLLRGLEFGRSALYDPLRSLTLRPRCSRLPLQGGRARASASAGGHTTPNVLGNVQTPREAFSPASPFSRRRIGHNPRHVPGLYQWIGELC